MSLATAWRWLKTGSVSTSRAFVWTVVGIALTCAALVLGLRYWVLPNIENYREDIAQAMSRAAKVRITIGRISADWEGIRPHLTLEDISVFDKTGRRALGLERVESTIAWRSLATVSLHFHSLDIYRPRLEVRRDRAGVVSIAGIELQDDNQKHSGFSAWLLEQPDMEVHDAVLSWSDDMRQAPPLELSRVYVQVLNRGSRHRFGVRAVPPPGLAGPVDVRGDLRGDRLDLVSEWSGKLFVQADTPDVAGWGPWITFPVEVTRAAGSVRAWITIGQRTIAEIIADVNLSGVRTRLRQDLPELDVNALHGRVAWKNLPDGFEVSTTQLALAGPDAALPPADFLLRVSADKQGVPQGELQADALSLPPLVMLADRLPLADELRTQLMQYAPRGSVHDLVVRWNGTWPTLQHYSVRGRFDQLAWNRREKLPGVSGLSGNIDATEKNGTLHLTSAGGAVDMPEVFSSALTFDKLTAQLGWTRTGDRIDLRFNNVSFANADAAGTVFGSYRIVPPTRGEIDLTGNLVHADARAVARYLPITELKKVRPWLERALVAGRSNDVRFRLKGRLDEFPFKDEKRGLFSLTARISEGVLDYADRWPRFENIEGDLQFRGTRMEFLARQGTISGVQLSKVQGEIPDMTAHPQVLTIGGEADGATPDFLAFIAKSPVSDMIDHFTDGAQAQGTGKLTLKLAMPLGEVSSSKVSGAYAFTGNQVVFERDVPPLEQASGRIEFTENSVRVPSVSGTFLGGPITITAGTQRDSAMRATLQGRVNIDNVRKTAGGSWMQYLRGSTDWRGVLTLRKKVPDLVIESNLQGITSTLPAPFAKTANETIPIRIDRRFISPQQDRISFAYADVARADFFRRNDGKQSVVERGIVRLGAGELGNADRPGIWIRGALKTFDFDDWLTLMRGSGSGEGEASYAISGADVKLGEVDFFGRRFSDVAVNSFSTDGATQFALTAPDVEGGVMWRAEGKGRLTARLRKLNLPLADAQPLVANPKPAAEKLADLPALDVIVEQFRYGPKQLGRLELNAVHQERDWRIERLRISNPDSVLTADGVWQAWLTQPRTHLSVHMDVTDIGRTLARWNYPAGVRGGTAKIDGELGWTGSPYDFDYPTLSGQLAIDAAKGQFLKLEPGIAKLLGILSLQSLPRRISLDFRDIFSEGFAFDGIVGSVRIERGIASTDNFRIAGPAARVLMSGDVDLARETQRLRVRVTPHLSESVSIAGALLGGPVAGVAAFLAQKILKDPIEQLISFDYNVTGSWSDPQVAKAERAAALAPSVEPGP